MEDKEILVKTIKKSFTSQIEAGITWFRFISAINGIKLAPRELDLLAYTNYRGTISSSSAKDEFVMLFDSSLGTVTNITARLLRIKVLVKEKSKIVVHPALKVDFNKELCIRFHMNVDKPKLESDDAD